MNFWGHRALNFNFFSENCSDTILETCHVSKKKIPPKIKIFKIPFHFGGA